ncbi:DUF397 domain-containing protein [Embleya hyalina]|uniref:DUF397 domain-containing protein n=1 Tax=Embleya hyalina TaxID=516124 RepID=UPI001FECA519|nr:DUF397 domain-containing protein [Embleya hyalina]
MTSIDRRPWRKSRYSNGDASCVEVAPLDSTATGVRDTKDRERGHLEIAPYAWSAMLKAIKPS